jgi:hypothetical protein
MLTGLVGVDNIITDFSTTAASAAQAFVVTGGIYGTFPDFATAVLARDTGHRVPAFRFKVA